MSIEVKILFFAKSREIVGKQVDSLEVPEKLSYVSLLDIIAEKYSLEDIKNNIILALNEEYCTAEQIITFKTGDEIAVIPPLSGVEDIMQKVTAPNCGAISLFVGTTRDNFESKKVLSLEYEAYEPMAEKAMKQICAEMRDKWKDLQSIAIYHRLGNVGVTESSVVIAISSPHRSDSLEATQWCIDTLKKSVPIWKKEVYEATEPEWKENSECPWSTAKKENNKAKFNLKPKIEIPNISSHLVQINCSNEEMQRRIDTFMQRKREQANIINIRDFCGVRNTEESCSRIDAVLKRQKNSKSHLRTQRVYNTYGPYNIRKKQSYISKAIEDRIGSLENCLSVEKPVAPDIYERLKKIEDKVLLLESISPEYSHFWNKEFMHFATDATENSTKEYNIENKQKFELSDVDNLLYELEKEAQIK